MSFLFKRWVLFLSLTALGSADKDTVFRPDAAARYPHHQTNATVTVAADPYVSGEKVQTAFGKLNPYEYGILPVLVVIQNDGNQSIRLDRIRPVYSSPQGEKSFAPISLKPLLTGLLLLQRLDDLADTLQLRYADFPRIWRAVYFPYQKNYSWESPAPSHPGSRMAFRRVNKKGGPATPGFSIAR